LGESVLTDARDDGHARNWLFNAADADADGTPRIREMTIRSSRNIRIVARIWGVRDDKLE
jgi:hypothetical protein